MLSEYLLILPKHSTPLIMKPYYINYMDMAFERTQITSVGLT